MKTKNGFLGTFPALKILQFKNMKEFNNIKMTLGDDFLEESVIFISKNAENFINSMINKIEFK